MPGSSSENSCVSCAMQRKELATMLASMVEGEPHYASTVKLFSKNKIEKKIIKIETLEEDSLDLIIPSPLPSLKIQITAG